ncbi:hypothetical protein AAFF_G00017910 [Aldrovandia affinis]|uniref:Uncharacterized protein n=1 Tax=Aldrovandia affinis TaxID=143900 RepID=A0AAD7S5U0_9TELE|nr:hypothetical protein AAFF_G00017910 [Aldrovandia affinis]
MRSFFNVVLLGPSVLHGREKISEDDNLDARERIACNISQLLIYNTSKGTPHAVKMDAVHHNKERETPFPLYHGLKLHGQGRNKKQIGIDHAHGISVSYKRAMEVKRGIARVVCARHAQDGVVLPTNSRLNVFTTHDVDNIDVRGAKVKDEVWMAYVNSVLKQGTLSEGDVITWSGFNSMLGSDVSVKPPAEIGVYPLFPDKAASASSMKHPMELTMQGTEFLNPGQTSVLSADQPLYAIIKLLQWQYPDTLGEDKLVAMMGALHIEDKMHQMHLFSWDQFGWRRLACCSA